MVAWKSVRENLLKDKSFADYAKEMQVAADVAHAIMDIRLYNGWTQKDLARLTGVPLRKIRQYEKMEKLPTLNALKKMAKAGGYTVRISLEQIDPDEVKVPHGALDDSAVSYD